MAVCHAAWVISKLEMAIEVVIKVALSLASHWANPASIGSNALVESLMRLEIAFERELPGACMTFERLYLS